MPKTARQLLEAPIDTGGYGDFIDRSHKQKIGAHRTPAMPDRHPEVLASKTYQNAMRKVARYTGINPRSGQDVMRVSQMMMQALQRVSQIERQHAEELEHLAVEFVLSMDEFKAAKEARDAGELKVVAQMTADIDLSGAEDEAEDISNREELKIEQIASELDMEVQKKRVLNMMVQGNAMNKLQAFHLVQNELNAIDPNLLNLYGVVTSVGEFGYWIMPEEVQKAQMSGREGAGGASHVEQDDGIPVIRAQGVTFPMLVHELVKALMEFLSYDQDMDSDTRKHVYGQADTLHNEVLDSQLGPAAWQHFVSLIKDQTLVPRVYRYVTELPASEFHKVMHTIMTGGPAAERTVAGIEQRVKAEDEADSQIESAKDVISRLLD